MTESQLLIAGISAVALALVTVWGVLMIVVRILWRRAEECESDRKNMRSAQEKQNGEIVKLTAQYNLVQGQVDAMRACPQPQCPMKRASRTPSPQ